MLLCEGASGWRFQIPLERDRTLPVGKCDGGLDAPWFELCGVGDFAGVMAALAIFEVFGQTRVETRGVCFALENVNVREIHA